MRGCLSLKIAFNNACQTRRQSSLSGRSCAQTQCITSGLGITQKEDLISTWEDHEFVPSSRSRLNWSNASTSWSVQPKSCGRQLSLYRLRNQPAPKPEVIDLCDEGEDSARSPTTTSEKEIKLKLKMLDV